MGRTNGRERTLSAALGLFLERGFHAATTQELADAAGVAKSLLHYHFDGKAAILRELVEPFLAALSAALAQVGADEPPIDDVLGRYVDVLLAFRGQVRLLNADVSSREVEDLGTRYDDLQEQWRGLLSDDEMLSTAVIGALTRPFVHSDIGNLAARRDDLVAVGLAALGAVSAPGERRQAAYQSR